MKKIIICLVCLVFTVSLIWSGGSGKAETLLDYQKALIKSTDYLILVQDPSGFWGKKPGGSWDADAENSTGNAITTLVKAYELTGDTDYLDSAKKAGDFLVEKFINGDGSFNIEYAEILGGNAYMNHLSPFLTAWIKLYQATGITAYKDAAVAFGNYLLTNGARCTKQGDPNYGLFAYLIRPENFYGTGDGWFGTADCPFYHGHYLNYGYEQIYGLALLYELTGNSDYLEAAKAGAAVELRYQKGDGPFPAEMPDIGTLGIHYGSVKILAYAKLYDITSDTKYKDAVINYVDWLLTQKNSDNSFGTGDFVRSTTWATKALLEASKLTGNTDYLNTVIKAADWLLEDGHGYDSEIGAVARYAVSDKVYITYSQTPFALTMAELVEVLAVPAEIEVPVDIKPQSCPNPLNVGAKGVLPVAILGTTDLDVTQVDLSSIKLEGVSPLRSDLEDVATPFEPFVDKRLATDCTTAGADGYMDLTLKFDNQAIASVLGSVTDGEVRVLKLTSNLKPEFGGIPIIGEDVVVIIKKK